MTQDAGRLAELDTLFRAHAWLEQLLESRSGGVRLFEQLIRPFRSAALEVWRQLFGSEIDSPAHRAFVLRWCRRNLDVLARGRLLSEAEHGTIDARLREELEALGETDPAYRFHAKTDTPHERELKMLYLVHSLNIRLHGMARAGEIEEGLYGALRRDLVKRAASLFASARGTEDEEEPARVRRVIEQLRSRGHLPEDLHRRIVEAISGPSAKPGIAPSPQLRADDPVARLAALSQVLGRIEERTDLDPTRKAAAREKVSREIASLVSQLSATPDPALVSACAREVGLEEETPADDRSHIESTLEVEALAGEAQASPAPERGIAWISDEWAVEILRDIETASARDPIDVELSATSPRPVPPPAPAIEPDPAPAPAVQESPPPPPPPRPPPPRPPPPQVRSVTPGGWGPGGGARTGTRVGPAENAGMREAWISMLSSLLQEFGIHWLLFSGVILTLAAGVLGAIQQWDDWSPVMRYLSLFGATAGFYLLALGTRLGMRLTKTPAAFFVLVLLFTPLNFVAMDAIGLLAGGAGETLRQGIIVAISIALLLFMGTSGSRAILDLPAMILAPGLLVVSAGYLVASGWGPGLGVPQRAGILVASLLIARFQLVACLPAFHARGLAMLPLACLTTAVVATGLRLGLDLVFVGLSLVAAGHLAWETSLILCRLAEVDDAGQPPALARSLASTGELAALIGASLLYFPGDADRRVALVALIYLARMMYLSFVTFRGGLEFLVFLPCPALILVLLPQVDPALRERLLGVLERSVHGMPAGKWVVALFPLILAAPFYARLGHRLRKRGLEHFQELLHIVAATLALAMMAAISPFTTVAQAGSLLMVLLWSTMTFRYRFQYMAILSALSGILGLTATWRYLGAPAWVQVFTLSMSALLLLWVHRRTAGRMMRGYDPFLCGDRAALAISQTASAGTLIALAWLGIMDEAGRAFPGWDLCLSSQIVYFIALAYVDYQVGLALLPVGLAAVELGIVAGRLGWIDPASPGLVPAALALLPLAAAGWLETEAARRWLGAHGPAALAEPGGCDALARYHRRFAQILAMGAFILPPYAMAPGVIKYLVIAALFASMGRRSEECAAFSLFSLGMAIHANQLEQMVDADVAALYQTIDAILGILLLEWGWRSGGSRPWEKVAPRGGVIFLTLSLVFFMLPMLAIHHGGAGRQAATVLAALVQTAVGLWLIVLAGRVRMEAYVYLGEVALALVYLRLLQDGWVAPSLVAAFFSLAAAFVLQVALPRFLAAGGVMEVYRRPAANTALVLPWVAIHRGAMFQGPAGALLLVGSAIFYHLVAVSRRRHDALILALILYNVAAAMAPQPPEWLTASRYLLPLGLTLIAYSHASYLGRPRESVQFWRMGGLILLYIDIIPRSVMGAHPGAFVLTLLLCVGIALLGILFRTKIYVLTGTCLMILTVIAVVIREVVQATMGGFLSLFFLGICLILLAAVFEGARERLRGLADRLQERFSDWD